MELREVTTRRGTAGRIRLSAIVAYDDALVPPEEYWYEVDENLADALSDSGNPWLVALLPLAVTLREPLRMGRAPVDSLLLENVKRLMAVWKSWYPALSIVPIEAEAFSSPRVPEAPSKTASFFSGGVDSYFTALRHQEEAPRIDEFLLVWGFNIPLSNREAFENMKASLEKSAAHFHHPLLDVGTNLKDTRLRVAGWGTLFYGPALASVGLALEKRYANVLISSTLDQSHLMPWGSHPLTDPLCSTCNTHILHDGAEWNRVQKTEGVAQDQELLDSLHVCSISFTDRNCGACQKCYLTMITLELLGKHSASFPAERITPNQIERVYLDQTMNLIFFEEVIALALYKGRKDIAEAIERSIRRSARLQKRLRVSEWLKRQRFVWRYAGAVERMLLGRSVL